MPCSEIPASTAKKRKSSTHPAKPSKKPRAVPTPKATTTTPPAATLIGPHEAIIADLSPKHAVLAASIISSSQIGKRVKYALSHLVALDEDHGKQDADVDSSSREQQQQQRKKRIVLLHARRTADVSKMLTVVELCKRTLSEKGRTWYQYNQLFEAAEEADKSKIEETILPSEEKVAEQNEKTQEEDSDDDEGDDDDASFEPVRSRFEDAVLPPPRARTTKSMRIFLSLEPIPDLREQPDVTVQSSEET